MFFFKKKRLVVFFFTKPDTRSDFVQVESRRVLDYGEKIRKSVWLSTFSIRSLWTLAVFMLERRTLKRRTLKLSRDSFNV